MPRGGLEKILLDAKNDDDDSDDEWTIMVDKGYQSITDYFRAVHFENKQPFEKLSPIENCRNENTKKVR